MEIKYMERALKLATFGIGKVNPNPLVGAVVVKNGKIVGEGYHHKFGEDHAEVIALDNARNNAVGADIYVTLEPCSHHGKTPPCVKKIIESGIKRCIIAMVDPNPLVAGRGIKILQDAGIEVVVGVLEKRALELNRVFIKYITEKKSYLFLKCGITLDGKIATRANNSKWITNEESRKKVKILRDKYMGIMVGIDTAIIDNPNLTTEIEGKRDPFRIIIDPNLRIPLNLKLLKFQDGKNIVITSDKNENNKKVKLLKNLGVRLIFIKGKNFSYDDILKETAKLGIDGILLEGGAGAISKAFKDGAIDGGEIFIAPKILGDEKALSFVKGFNIENISGAFNLKNVKFREYGDNISIEFFIRG